MEEYLKKKTIFELKALCKTFDVKPDVSKDKIIQKLLPTIFKEEKSQLLSQHFPPELILSIKNMPAQIPSCCKNPQSIFPDLQCSRCHEFQHKRCVLDNSKLTPYLCPSCILDKISPLEPVSETLVKAFRFTQNKFSGPNYEIDELSFVVSNEKKVEILTGDGLIQVQARCIRMDGDSIHQIWPIKGYLLVNDKVAMRFETSPNPNARKRKDEPLNLTTLINCGNNTIALVVISDSNAYFLNVVLVRKKTEYQLIKEIKENNFISVEKSKEFIRNLLKSIDPDIVSGVFKCELKCPMTMTLMKAPVRGLNCSHIGCFDLEPYILMQSTSKVNRWKCPLCRSYVYEMIYDLYIKEIIDKTRGGVDGSIIEISPNADYKIIQEEEGKKNSKDLPLKRQIETHAEIAKASKMNEFILIDLDSD